MLRPLLVRFLAASSALLAACGGSTLSAPPAGGDGGASRDAALRHDGATSDAPPSGDGGCIDPVVGEACTSTGSACPQVGDPCCIGYVWSCQNGSWAQLGLGCSCEVHPDAAVDAGPDCGQQSEPTYSCPTARDAASPDGGVCHAYGVDAGASGPTYPFGCTVTLATCSTFGGPQTCNCETFPGSGAAPSWVCPL